MNKKRLIFTTDAILIPLFILTLYTGVELHVAGHGGNPVLCHSRAIYHTLCSLLFALFALFHIQAHWRWYRQLFTQRTIHHRRRKAIIFTFSILFVAVALSGIGLLSVENLNSHLGLFHYKTAIVMGVLAILHISKRLGILAKGIKICNRHKPAPYKKRAQLPIYTLDIQGSKRIATFAPENALPRRGRGAPSSPRRK